MKKKLIFVVGAVVIIVIAVAALWNPVNDYLAERRYERSANAIHRSAEKLQTTSTIGKKLDNISSQLLTAHLSAYQSNQIDEMLSEVIEYMENGESEKALAKLAVIEEMLK